MRLAARGHEVRFFASERPFRLDTSLPRVSFHRVAPCAEPPLDGKDHALALAGALVQAAETGLDVIHAHYAIPHAAGAVLARSILRRTGVRTPRIVTTLHGTDVTTLGVDQEMREVVRHVAVESDGVTVPSRWLRDRAVENLDIEAGNIEVVSNFVDGAAFRPCAGDLRALFPNLESWDDPMRRPRVLFHGSSFRALKRVGDAVRALSLVRKSREAVLVLAGDGPEHPAVQAEVSRLGLSQYVRFLGPLAQYADLLGRADLFLLPSDTESFGLAALEALACGVPVVAGGVGGLVEVVRDGETGLLIPPAHPEALAAAIVSLLDDEPRRRAMSVAARTDALSRFSPEPSLTRYEQLLSAPSSGAAAGFPADRIKIQP